MRIPPITAAEREERDQALFARMNERMRLSFTATFAALLVSVNLYLQ